MSAFATLTLTDASAASVAFAPQSIDATGVARWLSSDAIFDSKKVVTMQVTLPKGKSPVSRVKQKIVVPIMDAVDTTKRVAEAYVNIEYVFPKQTSLAVRKDIRAFVSDITSEAVTTDAVENFGAVT